MIEAEDVQSINNPVPVSVDPVQEEASSTAPVDGLITGDPVVPSAPNTGVEDRTHSEIGWLAGAVFFVAAVLYLARMLYRSHDKNIH